MWKPGEATTVIDEFKYSAHWKGSERGQFKSHDECQRFCHAMNSCKSSWDVPSVLKKAGF